MLRADSSKQKKTEKVQQLLPSMFFPLNTKSSPTVTPGLFKRKREAATAAAPPDAAVTTDAAAPTAPTDTNSVKKQQNTKTKEEEVIDSLCESYFKAYYKIHHNGVYKDLVSEAKRKTRLEGKDCKDYFVVTKYAKTQGFMDHDSIVKMEYNRFVNSRQDSVKKTLKEIVETCKVKPKKLYRYFHHVKVCTLKSKNSFPIEHLLLKPFDFITFENQFISYKNAMDICNEKKIIPPLDKRVRAWIYDYFMAKQNNQLYIPESETGQLEMEFNKEFKLRSGNSAAQSLLLDSKLIVEKIFGTTSYFTTQEFIDFEIKLSDKVANLFYHEKEEIYSKENDAAIDAHIEKYTLKQHSNKKEAFKFEPEQVEAIKMGCRLNHMQLFNITGPPGTGKSTIVDCIMGYQLEMGSSIAVMAPTGLAQKNLKVYCKYDSKFDDKVMFSTLHRALNFTFNKGEFKPTIMIVDESSMVDLFLFEKLLSACECFRSSLILIGDVKQLPPISAGTPFESIIKSKIFNTTILTNIKRQEGNLKSIIEKMNTENGVHFDDFDNAYSHFIEAKTPEDFERVITEIYEKEHSQHRLQMTTPGVKTTTPHKEFDIHTMSVQREKNGGVFALNPIIQKIKNPHGKKLFVERYENGHTHIFHENDLVIRTENDYKDEKNVRVNGDVGTIHETVKQMKNKYGKNETVYTYTVKYDGETDETDLSVEDVRDAFMPFYVSSVHKMQGLQRNIIVFIVSPAHNFCLMNKNSKKLVYTAISRCKTTFYVVGDKSLFIKAQRAKDEFIYPTLFMNEFYEWVL